MPALLVSVRSAEEAAEALAGGADVIDIKDPTRGSLGMADPEVIQAVVGCVAGERPVSAALGELREWGNLADASDYGRGIGTRSVSELASNRGTLNSQLSTLNSCLPVDLSSLIYLKVGLAGFAGHSLEQIADKLRRFAAALCSVRSVDYRFEIRDLRFEKSAICNLQSQISNPPPTPHPPYPPRWVAVAYADSQRADAPRSELVAEMAAADNRFWGALLIDTWRKDGSTLLDWLSLEEIGRLCRDVRAAGIRVALAGSLGPNEIRRLQPLEPDLIAVRGAACRRRDRNASIDRRAVRELARMLHAEARRVEQTAT